MFLKALECEPTVVAKAMINLGLLYNTRGNIMAQSGDMAGASKAATTAAYYLDDGKSRLEALTSAGSLDSQLEEFARQYTPIRLGTHILTGQLHAGVGDMASCEAEFRHATEKFPDAAVAWQMYSRVLEMQGKNEEATAALDRAGSLVK